MTVSLDDVVTDDEKVADGVWIGVTLRVSSLVIVPRVTLPVNESDAVALELHEKLSTRL